MPIGKLQFQLYIGEEALPVSEAEIIIIDKVTGKPIVTGPVKLDESGKSKEVTLYTYDKKLSEISTSKQKPYKTYDAIIVSEYYRNVYIRDIQIFDGVKSIEKIQMYPKVRGAYDTEYIDIPPSTLEIKDKEEPKERLNEPIKGSTKVLNKVIIPQYITVHLGTPLSNAPNVTVSFTEYLKNVASSEIYPTWPREALKANIYAEISFTLNRIFTEWYRSRGYDFDITNSTAYDHCFIKGRNIFDTISEVVDEIFNEYTSKKGFLEPLLAQYCNGTTVTCQGLSQWGSVDYANAGNTAYQILKRYYGEDIELRISNLIQGIQESYPGQALRIGSIGESVKTIQRQLNRIRKNYPAIPKIPVEDGKFNALTNEAVKVFQKIFSLVPDGIVGKKTWYEISRIYVGVKKLGELESEGEKLPVNHKPPSIIIRLGSEGQAVTVAQYFLACISAFYDKVLPVNISGKFDNNTVVSVKSFQQLFGLDSDGIIGPKTWEKLYSVYKQIEPYILVGSGKIPTYPAHIIKEGDRGEDVKIVQQWLSIVSRKYTTIPKISVDGIFGPKTKEAVIKFQNQFGLSPDGLIGPITWRKLSEIYVSIVKETL